MSQAQNELLRSLMSEVTENLTKNLREVLTKSLETQLTEALTQSLLESEFYRKISKDMRGGLKKIYKELATSQANVNFDKEDTEKLFHEASAQLEAVLEQTESATDDIMSLVEKHLDIQIETEKILAKAKNQGLDKEEWELLEKNNFSLSEDLTTILTSLSFQDLTGQRIKRAVGAIKTLETMVLDLILSSGIMIKAYEAKPNSNIEELEEEANKAAINIRQKVQGSELKGPDGKNSQANIDDLLSQLGL